MPNPPKPAPVLAPLKRRAMERDKQQHLALSFALVVVFFLLFDSLLGAAAGTIALGLGKEVWDKYHGSGFCWFDMLANVLGTAAGIAIIVILSG